MTRFDTSPHPPSGRTLTDASVGAPIPVSGPLHNPQRDGRPPRAVHHRTATQAPRACTIGSPHRRSRGPQASANRRPNRRRGPRPPHPGTKPRHPGPCGRRFVTAPRRRPGTGAGTAPRPAASCGGHPRARRPVPREAPRARGSPPAHARAPPPWRPPARARPAAGRGGLPADRRRCRAGAPPPDRPPRRESSTRQTGERRRRRQAGRAPVPRTRAGRRRVRRRHRIPHALPLVPPTTAAMLRQPARRHKPRAGAPWPREGPPQTAGAPRRGAATPRLRRAVRPGPRAGRPETSSCRMGRPRSGCVPRALQRGRRSPSRAAPHRRPAPARRAAAAAHDRGVLRPACRTTSRSPTTGPAAGTPASSDGGGPPLGGLAASAGRQVPAP